MKKARKNDTCAPVTKESHKMPRVLHNEETVILGKTCLKQRYNKSSFLHLLSFSRVPLSLPCLQPSTLEKNGAKKAAPLTCFH